MNPQSVAADFFCGLLAERQPDATTTTTTTTASTVFSCRLDFKLAAPRVKRRNLLADFKVNTVCQVK